MEGKPVPYMRNRFFKCLCACIVYILENNTRSVPHCVFGISPVLPMLENNANYAYHRRVILARARGRNYEIRGYRTSPPVRGTFVEQMYRTSRGKRCKRNFGLCWHRRGRFTCTRPGVQFGRVNLFNLFDVFSRPPPSCARGNLAEM